MKIYSIEIDETVWQYLQKHAEPFVDTPNSVLKRMLFEEDVIRKKAIPVFSIPMVNIQGLPESLTHILEIVYEIEVNGYSRTEATNRVAKKRGTASQTITHKYCRQLGKRAPEIDELLKQPGYAAFKNLLKSRFGGQEEIIDMYFDTMMSDALDDN